MAIALEAKRIETADDDDETGNLVKPARCSFGYGPDFLNKSMLVEQFVAKRLPVAGARRLNQSGRRSVSSPKR